MIINYTNVHLKHDERTILSGVNMQVMAGDMMYLTGLVGSGKSTLMASMYGNTPICNGQAIVLKHDLRRINHNQMQFLRRRIGVVHQDLRLLSEHTVYENLDFVLRATDWTQKTLRDERIEEVLNWVHLSDKINCLPHELSGGQKQCICIARAMLNHPELILADEPTGQLDAENGERVIALLNDIREKTKCAVVISTHNAQWPVAFPGNIYHCENYTLTKVNE
ncbi:MAG: ATP-binding cassette domain-containing protein [Bacteroidaceae bacterium]|nr:ATP-binding cassette domain-containing protein [Bacteroidaceae bacterium]